MKYYINEKTIEKVVRNVIRESVNNSLIEDMKLRILSWMEEDYENTNDIEKYSPEMLKDRSNYDDYMDVAEQYAKDYGLSVNEIIPLMDKAIEMAYEDLKEYANISLDETVVDKFTPYSEEDRKRNFTPFTDRDKRNSFQRNPAYEKALRAAQMRKKKD